MARLKRVSLTGSAIKFLLTSGKRRVDSELPNDAEIVRLGYDHRDDIVYVVAKHESFPDIPEGTEIPLGHIEIAELEEVAA